MTACFYRCFDCRKTYSRDAVRYLCQDCSQSWRPGEPLDVF